jgi:hypothetical protein
MRKTLLVGGTLIVAAVLVVVLSDLFDLRLESVALLGLAAGAVVALVPDQGPAMRLAGFAAGLVAAWVGYLVRAGFLPDSVAGRAVSIVLVLAICVVVAAATAGRIPLWAPLLGAAALVGAYEYNYSAAPPEVTSTSVTAVTSLLMTAAVGFLAVALVSPRPEAAERRPRRAKSKAEVEKSDSFDEMMERAK